VLQLKFGFPILVKEFPLSRARKALVTGACGLIGRELVELLVRSDVQVTAIDKSPLSIPGTHRVELDLSTRPALSAWMDDDTTVFHLAASADVRKSVSDPRYDFNNTLCAFFDVLEAARQTGARVVFPSTASVFDADEPLPLSERSAKGPASPYAAAKLAGEAYALAYHRAYGVDVRIARMFSVYGPRMTRLAIYDIIRKLEQNPSRVEILGDGSQVRDYLHVRDAARGLEMIAERGSPGEDYNLASGVPVSITALTRAIARLMGCADVWIAPTGESFTGDAQRLYASISKIQSIGFAQEIPLETGLGETIAMVRSRPAKLEPVQAR
jgi:UDP-glucose 4-epimerase